MDVLTFLPVYFKCSLKFSFSSKNILRWISYGVCITWLLFNFNTGCLGFLILQEKITSWTCLLEIRIKTHLPLISQLLIFNRSLFRVLADKFVSGATEKKKEMLFAKSLEFNDNSFDNHQCSLKRIKDQGLNLLEHLN